MADDMHKSCMFNDMYCLSRARVGLILLCHFIAFCHRLTDKPRFEQSAPVWKPVEKCVRCSSRRTSLAQQKTTPTTEVAQHPPTTTSTTTRRHRQRQPQTANNNNNNNSNSSSSSSSSSNPLTSLPPVRPRTPALSTRHSQ